MYINLIRNAITFLGKKLDDSAVHYVINYVDIKYDNNLYWDVAITALP